MLQRIALKSTAQPQAIILPFDSEESATATNQANTTPVSLYTLAVVLRVGLLAAILLRALTFWQW